MAIFHQLTGSFLIADESRSERLIMNLPHLDIAITMWPYTVPLVWRPSLLRLSGGKIIGRQMPFRLCSARDRR